MGLNTKVWYVPDCQMEDILMEAVKRWARECAAKEIVDILNAKKFDAVYAEDVETAKKIVMDKIPEGSTIAVGGSVTLNETGIMDEIRSDKYKFIDRFNTPSFEAMLEKYREGLTSDVFVTSVNAVTKTGCLVCMDCTGNRISSMIFGPKKVIVVTGVNKIVDTVEDGMARAKKVAPLNAKRITHKTPCAVDCTNPPCDECTGPARVCNAIGIVDGCCYFPGRITVVVVPEELGY